MYWDKWEEAGRPSMPGINTDLRLDEYVRSFLPVIVTQRTIPEGRADLPSEMKRLGMRYYDRFEFMVRNHGLCGNNMLTIGRTPDDYPKGYWRDCS